MALAVAKNRRVYGLPIQQAAVQVLVATSEVTSPVEQVVTLFEVSSMSVSERPERLKRQVDQPVYRCSIVALTRRSWFDFDWNLHRPSIRPDLYAASRRMPPLHRAHHQYRVAPQVHHHLALNAATEMVSSDSMPPRIFYTVFR